MQVNVRRRQANGNVTVLALADVLSETSDTYRVKVHGESKLIEVNKAAVIPVTTLMGQPHVDRSVLLPSKSMGASHSLSRTVLATNV